MESSSISPRPNRKHTAAYFDHVQILYPLLDRQEFESNAFHPQLPDLLQRSSGFFALYHTVLALGCLFEGGGAFEPGKGDAWDLFQMALGKFPELLLLREKLVNAQVGDSHPKYRDLPTDVCLGCHCNGTCAPDMPNCQPSDANATFDRLYLRRARHAPKSETC
jgi:hypothetical protein